MDESFEVRGVNGPRDRGIAIVMMVDGDTSVQRVQSWVTYLTVDE